MNAPTKTELPWRCFFCGDVFTDAKEARDHFGCDTEDNWQPGCVDPLTKDEKERRAFIVELFTELDGEREENSELQNKAYLLGKVHDDLRTLFKGAKSVHQAFLEYDQMEGRALSAEAEVERLRALIDDACVAFERYDLPEHAFHYRRILEHAPSPTGREPT